jgi:DNA-binding transcriptional LysR family regulator
MRTKKTGTGFDLHALEAFHHVLREGSFSAAARAIGLKQPAISQQVASLEAALGTRLLDRRGRRVRATPAGRALGEYAARLLGLRDEAAAAVSRAAGAVRGELVVAGSTIPGTYLLPPAVRAFRDRHPAASVEARIGDSGEAEALVAADTAELGVTGVPPSGPAVEGKPFWKDELVLVAPPGAAFLPSGAGALGRRELARMPWVARERGSGTWKTVEEALRARGVDPGTLEVAARMGSTEAVLESVRLGIGASWVSRKAAEGDLRLGRLRTLPVRGLHIVRDCWWIVRRGRTLSPAAEAFREILVDQARDTTRNSGIPESGN